MIRTVRHSLSLLLSLAALALIPAAPTAVNAADSTARMELPAPDKTGGMPLMQALAQRRQRTGVLLVAGTLATVPDWPLLCGALGHPDDVDGMRQRTVSCDVLADRPWDAALYARRLHAALERALGE